MIERLGQCSGEAPIPRILAEHIAEQNAHRLRSLRCQIGQIHPHQLPRDIGRIGRQRKVRARDHHVMGQHQITDHCTVVGQPARLRGAGGGAQCGNEIGLGHAGQPLIGLIGDSPRFWRAMLGPDKPD